MVDIRDVRVVKAGKELFQHLSWKIEAGENWIVAGKNGCGKTTLLELLAGSLHASQGEIVYNFVEGTTWEEQFWDKKRKIKLIPTHAIHSLFRGDNDLYYQQRYYASNDATRTVRDLLGDGAHQIHNLTIPKSLSIDSLLDREVTRLSNGQLKKIVLLQSLIPDVPRMLLLDYPYEGLDRQSREDLSRFIDFISREHGVQIVLTDHYHELPSVMNRKLTLENFKIVEEASIYKKSNSGDHKAIVHLSPSSGERPVVEIRNLRIQYGATVILDNFNWTIRSGDRWALLGKNGSGKTTLFSLIFADHPMAYSQELYLFGKRRGTGESIWDIKKRINYLGPELVSYLNPKTIHKSALDFVKSSRKKLDVAKLESLIQYFQATEWVEKPVKFLSSGQLQLMLIKFFFRGEGNVIVG